MATPEAPASLLVVVLDVQATADIPIAALLRNHVLLFLNAYLALRSDNRLAVIAATQHCAQFVYENSRMEVAQKSRTEETATLPYANLKTRSPSAFEPFHELECHFMDGLQNVFTLAQERNSVRTTSVLASALSSALCCMNQVVVVYGGDELQPFLDINKCLQQEPLLNLQPRIFILAQGGESPLQYIPTMNAIFSAQKMNLPIDVCSLGAKTPSIFLQQAAHITGGAFVHAQQVDGLLQLLLMNVLPENALRKNKLVLPRPKEIDFRAACFCHKKIISTGYVCSVCLSIFCSHHSSCSTCGATFQNTNT